MTGASNSPTRNFDVASFLDGRRLSRYNYVLIALSCLVTLFDGLDMMLIAFVAPYIRADFTLTTGQLGSLFSAGLAGMVLGGVAFGWLGDRFGRRPLILAATYGFAVLTLATAGAGNYPQLLVLRFTDGVAIGGLVPLCWALNIECVSARVRASVITAIMIGYSVGVAVAGPLTNWLAPSHGWRMVFVVAGMASLAAAVVLSLALPESIRFLILRGGRRSAVCRWLRRLDPTLSLPVELQFVLPDDTPPQTVRKQTVLAHLFDGKLRWVTPLLWLAYSASSVSITLISTWSPSVLEALDFSRAAASTASAVANAAGAALGLLLMRFTDRYGPVTVILLPACAIPLLVIEGLVPLDAATFIVVCVIAQSLIGGAHFAVSSITALFYPTSLRASGAALAASIGKTASVFGPLIGVGVLTSGLPTVRLYAALAAFPLVLALSSAAMSVAVRERPPRARSSLCGL